MSTYDTDPIEKVAVALRALTYSEMQTLAECISDAFQAESTTHCWTYRHANALSKWAEGYEPAGDDDA